MSSCERCEHWTVQKQTHYGDGTTVVNWNSESGKGKCDSLGIETVADFGCNRFMEMENGRFSMEINTRVSVPSIPAIQKIDHVETITKPLAPWQYFKMIPCPDCNGGASGDVGGRGHRCAGTGMVRLYDDGYVGDEQTRLHPKEKEAGLAPIPKCPSCRMQINADWPFCPQCGTKLLKVAETEVISDALAGLPPAEPQP